VKADAVVADLGSLQSDLLQAMKDRWATPMAGG